MTTAASAGRESSASLRAIILTLLGVGLSIAAGIWIYQEGPRVGGIAPAMAREIDLWLLRLALVAAIAGACLVAALTLALAKWHRSRTQRTITDLTRRSQNTIALLEERIKEARTADELHQKMLAGLERRMAELAGVNTQLQNELNQRNRSEKALDQRRQELESSKNVLELHVQARSEDLRKLQRRYELILNSAGEGICGLDLEAKTSFVNPAVAKMTGWQIEELIGKPEQEIFTRKGPNGGGDNGGQGAHEHVFQRKDGSCFPVEFVKTPINENGREVGSVLVFKDITERRRVEESLAKKAQELTRSNAELEQFAFVASHDLQEPLRKIQAFGDRLKARVDGEQAAEARDYLERMQKAAARMQTLINDLLAFSRVIRDSRPFAPVNLATVTREVLGDLEVRVEKTGARVEVEPLPTIEADPLQMRQLLLNLIGNALKFQPPGGAPHVKIQAQRIDGKSANGSQAADASASAQEYCEISIQDNGIGFEDKYVDKMFAVFQRLHGRSEYEGTGIGLAVCRRITDRHGGTISARGKPGEGATFTVVLPVKQPKKQPKP